MTNERRHIAIMVIKIHLLHPSMAKEIGNPSGPPSVFQMFNESRTYYFESDISSLPHLPCTVPAPVVHHGTPVLKKSFSQPALNVQLTASTGQPASTQPAGNLHLPAAIMSTTTYHTPASTHPGNQGSSSLKSLESRYQTEPSYRSSTILKSFCHEIKLFGGNTKRDSVSAPTSPRRASSPELDLTGMRPRTESDPRKLSLVQEETEKEIKTEIQKLSSQHISEIREMKSETKSKTTSPLLSSVPRDSVDGELLKRHDKSITRQVMTWFVTPQKQTDAKMSKIETNALSPTSF